MRWTQENEQTLLRVMFETQDMHIDLDKISKAWPGDDKPTPKALKEHLSKYRTKGQGTITFAMKAGASDGAAGTPRKRRSPKKVAAVDKEAESNTALGDELIPPTTPTKRPASDNAGSPEKRRSPKKLLKESDVVEATDDA